MARGIPAVLLSVALVAILAAGADDARGQAGSASGQAPGTRREATIPPELLTDRLIVEPIRLRAEAASVDHTAAARLAQPPGVAPRHVRAGMTGGLERLAENEAWRVDDGTPALRVNLASGPTHGFANRFDPFDSADASGTPPRPVTLRQIHFWVNGTGEPTGPMEWHVWEDNGGHKADPTRDIVPPFVVTGAPGQNVIDLESLGIDVRIDPPRLFHVGVAHKESEATSPDVLMDDGLPYVGDSGDFHGSITYHDQNCNHDTWGLLAMDIQDGKGARSPAWMIWLDVEWGEPPTDVRFDRTAGPGVPAGDFASAGRVAWGDYDRDGDEDILSSGTALYRNDGDGVFTDVTADAGITDGGGGGIWADYDNDGDLDFYQYTGNCVPCGQEDNFDDLWRNDGDGTFTNVRAVDYGGDPNAPVPRDPLPTEGATWADFNGDGYLDLYAANHVDWASGTCYDDYLWLNEGPPAYAFRDVSVASGIRAATLCGRGVNAADFDDDGDQDIFVSNYRLKPDLLWVNQGIDRNGVPRFVDEAAARGVRGVAKAGAYAGAFGHTIGAVWGDLDNDADTDMVAANLAHSAWRCFSDATMVYASNGSAGGYGFTDVRAASGVEYVETHSDPSLVDIDNDGDLDLHITHVYDGWRASTYLNVTGEGVFTETQGIRFAQVTDTSGIYPRTGWGTGWADHDLDGDLDLAAQGLWTNRAERSGNHWLQVQAVGCGASNRDAIGARITVATAGGDRWQREVVAARGTGSQDSRVQQFGLGEPAVARPVTLTVAFPSGRTETRMDVGVDARSTVVELGAWVRPAVPWVYVDEPVDLLADACGATGRTFAWDLDGDGRFDEGDGATVTARFARADPMHEVAVRVSAAGESAVSRGRIAVLASPAIFLPLLARLAEL